MERIKALLHVRVMVKTMEKLFHSEKVKKLRREK